MAVTPALGSDAARPRAGGGRRSLPLDDYSGHTAMGAVDAARAAGLHPAPERVESDDSGAFGLVVAQDPAAGEEVARGAVVTLYVAAPSSAGRAEGDRPADGDLAGDPANGPASERDCGGAAAVVDGPGGAEPPVEADPEEEEEILELPLMGPESAAIEPGGRAPGPSERRRRRPSIAVAVGVVATLCLTFAILLLAASQQRPPRGNPTGAGARAPQTPHPAVRARVRPAPRRTRARAAPRRHLDPPATHVRRRGDAPRRKQVRRQHPAERAQGPAPPGPRGHPAPASGTAPVPDEFF